MRERRFAPVPTAWVPVTTGADPAAAIAAALAVAERVVLAGYVRVPDPGALSEGAATAREVRRLLRRWSGGPRLRARARVMVSPAPWLDLMTTAREAPPDLLVLDWETGFAALGVSPQAVLDAPPCDLAVVRGTLQGRRGGCWCRCAAALTPSSRCGSAWRCARPT